MISSANFGLHAYVAGIGIYISGSHTMTVQTDGQCTVWGGS